MTIQNCPNCNQRFAFNPYTDSDYQHKCNSGIAEIDNEDILRLGEYIDDAGNTITVPNALKQGIGNSLWGTEGGIRGEDLDDLTIRGSRTQTHRTHSKEVSFMVKK